MKVQAIVLTATDDSTETHAIEKEIDGTETDDELKRDFVNFVSFKFGEDVDFKRIAVIDFVRTK